MDDLTETGVSIIDMNDVSEGFDTGNIRAACKVVRPVVFYL